LKVLIAITTLIFGATFLALPRNGGGWFWDIGGGLGFLAFAGLLFQMIPRARAGTGKRHEVLGYWVLATAIAHAFWLLAGDGVVRFYLEPGAPSYMWLGLAALLALALMAILARMPDRMRVHGRFQVFRRVHRILGFTIVITAALHVVLSGFYLPTWPQVLLVGLASLAMCFGRTAWARLSEPPAASGLGYLLAGGIATGLFVAIRNIAA